MRDWTGASLLPAGVVVRLLVALSVLPLVCVPVSGVYRHIKSCRSKFGSPYTRFVPDWWVPMFSPVRAGPSDSHLCGYALRLGTGEFFLANKLAVDRIASLEVETGEQAARFNFRPDVYPLNLSAPNLADLGYAPRSHLTLYENIAFYSLHVPTNRPNRDQTRPPFWERQISVRDVRESLLKDKKAKLKNCFIMTYAYEDADTVDPWYEQAVSVRCLDVVEEGCDGSVCHMATADEGSGTGKLCGNYANLGNAVLCGHPQHLKIAYIVTGMGWRDSSREKNCTRLFRAYKVPDLCEVLPMMPKPERGLECK